MVVPAYFLRNFSDVVGTGNSIKHVTGQVRVLTSHIQGLDDLFSVPMKLNLVLLEISAAVVTGHW